MDIVKLNGVNVYPFTSVDHLLSYIDEHKGILVAINAEKILHATNQTREIINRNVGYCDGSGALMAVKQMGYSDAVKIPGCELWLRIIEKCEKSKSIYLIGSRPAVITETVEKLRKEYPSINIVGFRDGYIRSDAEKKALLDDIMGKKPEIVFVAMGSPKQELLMEEIQQVNPCISQGLGGSFDVYTGHVERAPKWWVDHNVEFAYRLIKEPRRIKRQIHLVKYAYWLISGKFRTKENIRAQPV